MEKIYRILSFIISLIVFVSCSLTRILPDQPVPGNLSDRPTQQDSHISLPLEMDISSIESYINQKLPNGLILSESKREGNTTRYSYNIYRNKPVKFSAKGNELIFSVPIDIQASGSYTACAGFWRHGHCCSTPNPFGNGCLTPGITTTENGTSSPTVNVELKVKLELQENYSVKAETYLSGNLSGDTHLHIDLLGDLIRININIRDELEKPLQKFVKDYQVEIDHKISLLVEQYNLKNEVAKYWEEMKKPVQLGDLWLKVEPKQITFENLNAKNDKLRIALGIISQLEIVSEKPDVSNSELPSLTLSKNTQGIFNIYLPVKANFNYIENQLKEDFKGEKYNKDGVSVNLLDLKIQGMKLNNTSLLLLNLSIKGKAKSKVFKGNIYFTAIPGINDEKKIMYIEEFKIEPHTNSFLIDNGLPFLIDNFYYHDIQDQLSYSYKSEYNKLFKLINDELKKIELDNLVISGELKKITVPGLYIDSDFIELILKANGELKSNMKL